jgi:hypothetical protein
MSESGANERDDASAVASRWESKQVARQFETAIRDQEDQLFGIALYFEGIQYIYAGHESLIETYRKELRNVIQLGRQKLDEAHRLLEAARGDPSQTAAMRNFRFPACHGASRPAELEQRARLLVATYADLFPRRPRATALSEAEVAALITAASDRMDLAGAGPR